MSRRNDTLPMFSSFRSEGLSLGVNEHPCIRGGKDSARKQFLLGLFRLIHYGSTL